MTNHSQSEIQLFYLDYLKTLISHPNCFAGFLFDAESHLLGLEALAITAAASIKSYRDYLEFCGYSKNSFVSQFCIEHNCSIELLDLKDSNSEAESRMASLVSGMRKHIHQYATWRRTLPQSRIEKFYLDYLELLVNRPPSLLDQAMFTEAHLYGIDLLAIFLTKKQFRTYREYLAENKFFEHSFESRFCRENDCRFALFSEINPDSIDELRSEFKVKQRQHFQNFYDWELRTISKEIKRVSDGLNLWQ